MGGSQSANIFNGHLKNVLVKLSKNFQIKIIHQTNENNIDNLKDTVNENYKKRKAEVIKAELYIEEFLVEFDDWTNTRLLRPSILSLKKQVRELFLNETISNIKSFSENTTSKDLSLKLSKAYDKFSDNLVKKIKKASDNGKDEKAIDIINQIFLDEK